MKKLFYLLCTAIMVLSCSTTRYVATDTEPIPQIDVRDVLVQCYPNLVPYYDEDVLVVKSIRRRGGEFDNPNYIVKYRFVKYYYSDHNEMVACLQARYPDLYEAYASGKIVITSLYKYVDDNGLIRYSVAYKSVYEPYYVYRPLIYPRTYYWRYHHPHYSRIYRARPHYPAHVPGKPHVTPDHNYPPNHGSQPPKSNGNHQPRPHSGNVGHSTPSHNSPAPRPRTSSSSGSMRSSSGRR